MQVAADAINRHCSAENEESLTLCRQQRDTVASDLRRLHTRMQSVNRWAWRGEEESFILDDDGQWVSMRDLEVALENESTVPIEQPPQKIPADPTAMAALIVSGAPGLREGDKVQQLASIVEEHAGAITALKRSLEHHYHVADRDMAFPRTSTKVRFVEPLEVKGTEPLDD